MNLAEKFTFFFLLLFGISTSISISGNNILLGFLCIIFLINCKRNKKIFYTAEGISLILLFFWRSIRVFSHPKNWFKLGGKFWDHLPYFLIPNLPVKKVKSIIFATLLFATLISFLGILQILFGYKFLFLPRQIISSRDEFIGLNFTFRMHSAGYYSIIAVVSLGFFCFLRENWRIKIFLFTCSVLNILAVFLTRARTYYVALSLVILLLFWKKNIRWLILGFFLISFSLVKLWEYRPELKKRSCSIFDTKNVSNVERFWMWKTAYHMIKKKPLFGIGFETWQEEIVKYWEKEKGEYPLKWIIEQFGTEEGILEAYQSHPHNTYLNVLVEDGLIGLAFFLFFWIGNTIQAFRRASKLAEGSLPYALNLAVGFAILMLLIGSFFECNLTTARLLLPITFLIGLSYLPAESE